MADISNLNQSDIHPKIEKSLSLMLFQYNDIRFYAEFLMFVNFSENNSWCPTMAVGIKAGSPRFWWNRKFVEKLTDAQINFVLIHECMHLLGNHSARGERLSHVLTDYSSNLANIAMDMVINTLILQSKLPEHIAKMPEGWVVPKYYTGGMIWEEVYMFLREKKQEYEQWKKENPDKAPKKPTLDDLKKLAEDMKKEDEAKEKQKGEGEEAPEGQPQPDPNGQTEDPDGAPVDGEGQGKGGKGDFDPNAEPTFSDGCPVEDKLRKLFEGENGPSFDIHDMLKDVPDDLREAIVKDIVQGLRNRGLVTQNIEAMLEKINPTKKDHLKDILAGVAFVKGRNKMATFRRQNRRGIEGIKGTVKVGAEICCVLDTSGSMAGYIEKVLGVIFRDSITVHIAQCDTDVKQIVRAEKRSDIQKMQVKGFGGTTLQPAIDMFKAHKSLKKLNIVVLTDGVCDSLDLSGFKKALVVTCQTEVPIIKPAMHMRHVNIQPGK